MSGPCYVFDIDGTLSDPSHRLHYITGEKKYWDLFFDACDGDGFHFPMCDLARDLSASAAIILITGRSDQCRDKTLNWVDRSLVLHSGLYMRKAGDHRPDDIVKSELMDKAIADGWQPLMVFEDRKRVVDMWRKRGIACAQVAEGDF